MVVVGEMDRAFGGARHDCEFVRVHLWKERQLYQLRCAC